MIISNGAAEYLEAAKKLMVDPVSAPHPFWFCAFQSIELSLKAFLRGKGFSKEQLKSRDLGHKLDVLYKESVANALADHVTLTVAEESVVCEVGAMYCQKVFQYTETGWSTLPFAHVALDLAEKLYLGIRPFAEAQRTAHHDSPTAVRN